MGKRNGMGWLPRVRKAVCAKGRQVEGWRCKASWAPSVMRRRWDFPAGQCEIAALRASRPRSSSRAGARRGGRSRGCRSENSLAGPVAEHYDLLLTHDAAIERESMLRIRHNLIGVPGATLAGLRKVMSHPDPCAWRSAARFLAGQPQIQVQPFYEHRLQARCDKHDGALRDSPEGRDAGRHRQRAQAAKQYGGEILFARILRTTRRTSPAST